MAAQNRGRDAPWLSVRAAAARLKIAPQTVHRLIADQVLGGSKLMTESGTSRTLVCAASVAQEVARRGDLPAA